MVGTLRTGRGTNAKITKRPTTFLFRPRYARALVSHGLLHTLMQCGTDAGREAELVLSSVHAVFVSQAVRTGSDRRRMGRSDRWLESCPGQAFNVLHRTERRALGLQGMRDRQGSTTRKDRNRKAQARRNDGRRSARRCSKNVSLLLLSFC